MVKNTKRLKNAVIKVALPRNIVLKYGIIKKATHAAAIYNPLDMMEDFIYELTMGSSLGTGGLCIIDGSGG